MKMNANILHIFICILKLHTSISTSVDPAICGYYSTHDEQECHHNQSHLCDRNAPVQSCSHMVSPSVVCNFTRLSFDMCGLVKDTLIKYNYDEVPILLSIYNYKTWILTRPSLNVSFHQIQSKNFSFSLTNEDQQFCRRFTLDSMITEVQQDYGEVYWDCLMFEKERSVYYSLTLTDEKHFGIYSFRMPLLNNFDKSVTRMKDWTVFFYLHNHYIHKSSILPVTLQMAPFNSIGYNIALVKCHDTKCHYHTTLVSFDIGEDDVRITDGDTSHLTLLLQQWTSPGRYAVSVQIVSPYCDEQCLKTFSNIYEIPVKKRTVWFTSIIINLLMLFAFLCIVLFIYRKYRMAVKSKTGIKVSTLLVYVANTDQYLQFVKEFAKFLEIHCQIQPKLVDKDVDTMNPYDWTVMQLNRCERVILLVPEDALVPSASPIKSLWWHVLDHITSPDVSHGNSTYALIVFPNSGAVPPKIKHLKKFRLFRDLINLLLWLHGDDVFHRLFWWQRKLNKINTTNNKNKSFNSSLQMLQSMMKEITNLQVCHNDKSLHSIKSSNYTKQDKLEMTNRNESFNLNYKLQSSFDKIFDPSLPNVNTVINDCTQSVIPSEKDVIVDDSDEFTAMLLGTLKHN